MIGMIIMVLFIYGHLLKYLELPLFANILILSIMTILISNNIIMENKIKEDKKVSYSKKINTKNKRLSLIKVFRYTYKHIFSIIIGMFVILYNFVDDIYYYGATIATLVLVVWGFLDLIKCHNIVTSTKLPQLEKRGGDENE